MRHIDKFVIFPWNQSTLIQCKAEKFVEMCMLRLYLKCGCLGYKSNYFFNLKAKIIIISLKVDGVFSTGMGLSLLKPPSRSVGPSRPTTYTKRVVSEPPSRSVGPTRPATCTGRVV